VVFRSPVLQIKALRKLEVELDGRTLEGPAKCVADCDVNFWSVECAVSGIDFPFSRMVLLECLLELLRNKDLL
jgi:hypothetical protein